jgi:DNA polymerase III delta prime subunit
MVDHAEVQGAVDAAVARGQFPDRKAAVVGMMKQLVDYKKGALKGKVAVDPVGGVEKAREALWQALLKEAGGDEEKAVQLYAEELKKLSEPAH